MHVGIQFVFDGFSTIRAPDDRFQLPPDFWHAHTLSTLFSYEYDYEFSSVIFFYFLQPATFNAGTRRAQLIDLLSDL